VNWLGKLLSSPDKNTRARAVNCPVCWAPPRSPCYRMKKDSKGHLVRGAGYRPVPHAARFTRLNRRTGL